MFRNGRLRLAEVVHAHAADGATVSTPLAWSELTPKLSPKAFTLRTIRDRIAKVGDLAAPLLGEGARLDKALAQLRAQIRL